MRVIISGLIFVLFSATSASSASSMICYNDGTIVVKEVTAVKGLAELSLAAGFMDGTLKAEPAIGTTIVSVDINPGILDGKSSKEVESLTEQRQRLEDRLRALDTREDIFKAAAKSQSGKAPRKTKSNPDPMQTIRQGTDFAIAQLETVYTTRRKTTQELGRIDAKIEAAKKGARSGDGSVRIAVTPPQGRVMIRYATSRIKWRPYYDLHLAGDGFARIQFSARMEENVASYLLKVSPASLNDSATAATFPVTPGGSAKLADYRFPVAEERYGNDIFNSFSGRVTNTSTQNLPQGEARLYKNGAYLGKIRFEGLSSGRSKVISLGR